MKSELDSDFLVLLELIREYLRVGINIIVVHLNSFSVVASAHTSYLALQGQKSSETMLKCNCHNCVIG